MTVQTLKIGGREFVLVPKRDFQKLAVRARSEEIEDAYWTRAALEAESKSRAKGEKPIPFEDVERELRSQTRRRSARRTNRTQK